MKQGKARAERKIVVLVRGAYGTAKPQGYEEWVSIVEEALEAATPPPVVETVADIAALETRIGRIGQGGVHAVVFFSRDALDEAKRVQRKHQVSCFLLTGGLYNRSNPDKVIIIDKAYIDANELRRVILR